jgi:allantoate deiminase
MIIAQRLPCTMLFVRSPGGISHHPDERVFPEDIDAAFAAAIEFLKLLRDDTTIPRDDHA